MHQYNYKQMMGARLCAYHKKRQQQQANIVASGQLNNEENIFVIFDALKTHTGMVQSANLNSAQQMGSQFNRSAWISGSV